jgi:predicted MFS family arabinose efflux permease
MSRVLRNPHTWPPFLAFFFAYAAMGNLMLWAVPFLRDVYNLGTTRAALYAMSTSLALLVSAPITGYVSDHVLKRRKLPYTVLAAATCVIWIVFVATLGVLPLWGVYAVLFGMGPRGQPSDVAARLRGQPAGLAGIAVAVVNSAASRRRARGPAVLDAAGRASPRRVRVSIRSTPIRPPSRSALPSRWPPR